MVKHIESDRISNPTILSSSYNMPTNDVQSKAYQRAESIYRQHKVLIDKLANK